MVRDYSSIYNIKDFIVNGIAPNYYDIEDLSMLNIGWFGLTTETMSTLMEDTMRTTSRYITELIPGQSKLSEFIYAQAANYGISDIFATCSSCDAILYVKEKNILEDGRKNGKYIEYIIDADMLVYINDVPFSIPSDIKICAYLYNGNYKYRCNYMTDIRNSILRDTNDTYIKSIRTRILDPLVENTEYYIGMHVKLYQYQRIRRSYPLMMNSKLNIPYVDVEYTDNICNFEAMYIASGSSTPVQLKKFLTTAAPSNAPFCYYNLAEGNILRLTFASDDRYFIPEYNSTIEVYMYECLGIKGNFPRYTGDVYVAPSTQNEAIEYNNKNALYCDMVGDAMGARDAYTLEEIRRLTDQAQITVNSITTDNDLDQWFETYTTVYNTYAKFIKLRHDLVNRI